MVDTPNRRYFLTTQQPSSPSGSALIGQAARIASTDLGFDDLARTLQARANEERGLALRQRAEDYEASLTAELADFDTRQRAITAPEDWYRDQKETISATLEESGGRWAQQEKVLKQQILNSKFSTVAREAVNLTRTRLTNEFEAKQASLRATMYDTQQDIMLGRATPDQLDEMKIVYMAQFDAAVRRGLRDPAERESYQQGMEIGLAVASTQAEFLQMDSVQRKELLAKLQSGQMEIAPNMTPEQTIEVVRALAVADGHIDAYNTAVLQEQQTGLMAEIATLNIAKMRAAEDNDILAFRNLNARTEALFAGAPDELKPMIASALYTSSVRYEAELDQYNERQAALFAMDQLRERAQRQGVVLGDPPPIINDPRLIVSLMQADFEGQLAARDDEAANSVATIDNQIKLQYLRENDYPVQAMIGDPTEMDYQPRRLNNLLNVLVSHMDRMSEQERADLRAQAAETNMEMAVAELKLINQQLQENPQDLLSAYAMQLSQQFKNDPVAQLRYYNNALSRLSGGEQQEVKQTTASMLLDEIRASRDQLESMGFQADSQMFNDLQRRALNGIADPANAVAVLRGIAEQAQARVRKAVEDQKKTAPVAARLFPGLPYNGAVAQNTKDNRGHVDTLLGITRQGLYDGTAMKDVQRSIDRGVPSAAWLAEIDSALVAVLDNDPEGIAQGINILTQLWRPIMGMDGTNTNNPFVLDQSGLSFKKQAMIVAAIAGQANGPGAGARYAQAIANNTEMRALTDEQRTMAADTLDTAVRARIAALDGKGWDWANAQMKDVNIPAAVQTEMTNLIRSIGMDTFTPEEVYSWAANTVLQRWQPSKYAGPDRQVGMMVGAPEHIASIGGDMTFFEQRLRQTLSLADPEQFAGDVSVDAILEGDRLDMPRLKLSYLGIENGQHVWVPHLRGVASGITQGPVADKNGTPLKLRIDLTTIDLARRQDAQRKLAEAEGRAPVLRVGPVNWDALKGALPFNELYPDVNVGPVNTDALGRSLPFNFIVPPGEPGPVDNEGQVE